MYFIEIKLNEVYGVIAQKIAQLLTGKTILMGGGYGRSDSPLKETVKNLNLKTNISH